MKKLPREKTKKRQTYYSNVRARTRHTPVFTNPFTINGSIVYITEGN